MKKYVRLNNTIYQRYEMKLYQIQLHDTVQIGFGTAGRPPLQDGGAEAPGPGAYRLKSTM